MGKDGLVKRLGMLALTGIMLIMPSGTALAMRNPSAVYCQEMGYEYQTKKTSSGQKDVCVVNGVEYNAWDFFQGKVGKEHSYCEREGYDTITKTDGKNPFSRDYAVCVSKNLEEKTLQTQEARTAQSTTNQEIPMYQLMGLENKLQDNSVQEPVMIPETTSQISPAPSTRSTLSATLLSITPQSDYPAEFDWRNEDGRNWMTPVKNQGPYNLCQTFASIGAIEAKEKIVAGNARLNPDLSEQEIPCKGVIDYYSGGYPGTVLNYIKTNEIVEESVLPYIGTSSSCQIPLDAKKHFITNWNAIDETWPLTSLEKREATKKALIEKGPLVASMYIGGGGYFDENHIYKCVSPGGLNHVVVLVGYNDTGDVYTSSWEAKNSFGDNWNDDGYFKIGWGNPSTPNLSLSGQCMILTYSPLFVETPKPNFSNKGMPWIPLLLLDK